MSRNRSTRTRFALFNAIRTGIGYGFHNTPPDPTAGAGGGGAGAGAAAAAPADPYPQKREEFARLEGEAQGVLDAAATANRALTADEETANATRFSRMETIKKTLDAKLKFARMALDGDAGNVGRAQVGSEPPGRAAADAAEGRTGYSAGAGATAGTAAQQAEREEFGRAATKWAVTGEMPRKFATITTSSNSGILLPRSIGVPITPNSSNAFREAHALFGVKPIETANTADLTIPVLDAQSGGVVAENAASETETAPALGESIRLTPRTYQSGSAWFSNQQLAANDFDLLQSVVPQLTYSKELGLESVIVAAIIADSLITQVVPTATPTGFTYANLVDLHRAVPKRYDRQKFIVLSAAAFSAAEKLVGSDGHPVLIVDPQNEGVTRFLGTPCLRSDYFEAFGLTKCLGVCASLLGFKLRDVTVQNLARYVNIPSRPNQTGINLFAYHAFGWAPSAIAKLMTPAS
jgi:HK97 family phage major capsid protein